MGKVFGSCFGGKEREGGRQVKMKMDDADEGGMGEERLGGGKRRG